MRVVWSQFIKKEHTHSSRTFHHTSAIAPPQYDTTGTTPYFLMRANINNNLREVDMLMQLIHRLSRENTRMRRQLYRLNNRCVQLEETNQNLQVALAVHVTMTTDIIDY